ncbi:MAG: VTT domain-containing protein [Myxococcota bacterium]|nr:VTT domain-containing protein [Myxococcota bacterium]
MGRGTITVTCVALAALGLALAWALTPLRSVIEPRSLLAGAEQLRASGWGIVLVPPAFVLLSLAMVPTSLLRWTTVLAFSPLFGVLCMVLGVACATLLGHMIGQRIGADRLARIGGDRVHRIRARLERTGVLGIAALRQVPLGPFMIVNAVAGAARVRRNVFVAGTVLGMVPGVIVMVLAGSSLRAWLLS